MAKWIAKANNDVLSFCSCDEALASVPGQLDCPWCGCGWLISCSFCRKAFTFGRVILIDRSTAEMVAADMTRGGYTVTAEDITRDAEAMEAMLEPFQPGDIVVYLDGCYVGEGEALAFNGLYARHEFDRPPQVDARDAGQSLKDTLERVDYWLERERPDRE